MVNEEQTNSRIEQYQYDIGYFRRKDSLNLFSWHTVSNYGDKLGPALFYLLSKKPVYIESRGLSLTFKRGKPRTIFCFSGTLAHLIYGPHKFVFWGFGSAPPEGPKHHGCQPIKRGLDIDFHTLRGPLTQKLLTQTGYKVPENIPYGDPALLVPYFFKRSSEVVDQFCIVPHHNHYEEWKERFKSQNVIDIKINSYEDIPSLIEEITKYKVIFSSSLHVTILAESFGIPTNPVEPTLPFKFDDFYSGCNKKISYIEKVPANFNWDELFVNTFKEWKPIKWDPLPWLDVAPFNIDDDIKQSLHKHYETLSNLKKPIKISGGYLLDSGENNSLREFLIRKKDSTEKTNLESAYKEEKLFADDFQRGLNNWDTNIENKSFKLDKNGCEINFSQNNDYLVTKFFEIGKISEIVASFQIHITKGRLEVQLQDDDFETWESMTIKDNDINKTYSLNFWPIDDKMRFRLVFLPIKGKILINNVKVYAKIKKL